MRKTVVAPLVLFVLTASFAIGWRAPSASPPEGLVTPLNMTLAEQTLYVSDKVNGVHIFDVADPAAPRPVAHIALQGNRGTAVKDDVLYAGEWNKLHVYRRGGDAFTLVTTLESEYDYYDSPPNPGFDEGESYFSCNCGTAYAPNAPRATSNGSSYATFAVIDDYLYRVDNSVLIVYDIATPDEPKVLVRKTFDFVIETIYPTEQLLFMGGRIGMYVYDRADPAAPQLIGSVEHFRACDPVVVSGSVAYVTLRGGNCGDLINRLLTVNIADPSKPFIAAQKELANPHGLAVRDPFLYVSTGASGYLLFDVTRPTAPEVLGAWPDWPTLDFLWSDDVLFVLGFDDVRIFDVTDPKAPVLLSKIENDPS